MSLTVSKPLPHRRQARSAQTVARILGATASLLVERGYEGVNTNAVAERAGVKPPALYRYFPNKFALFFSLTEQLHAELDADLDAALADSDAVSLAELVDRVIGAAGAFWLRRPVFAALWYGEWAVRGDPAPVAVFGARTVERLCAATGRFRRHGPVRERLILAGAMQVGFALVNLAAAVPDPDERLFMLGEAKRAVSAYLAPLESSLG